MGDRVHHRRAGCCLAAFSSASLMLSCSTRTFGSRVIVNGCRTLPRGSHDDSRKNTRANEQGKGKESRAVRRPVKEGQVLLEDPSHNCR